MYDEPKLTLQNNRELRMVDDNLSSISLRLIQIDDKITVIDRINRKNNQQFPLFFVGYSQQYAAYSLINFL